MREGRVTKDRNEDTEQAEEINRNYVEYSKIGRKLKTKASIYKDSKDAKTARTDLPSLT